jgi:hypothetical protein
MMRISRFTAEKFESETARFADFKLMIETRKTSATDDPRCRSIAPLRLNAALRARLPSLQRGATDGRTLKLFQNVGNQYWNKLFQFIAPSCTTSSKSAVNPDIQSWHRNS